MAESGDIYKVKIYFEETSGEFKSRPALILIYNDSSHYTIAKITSVPPKDPPTYYDSFKEEIIGWKEYGLDKPSYVKCKNTHNVDDLELYEKIGTMKNTKEFERIVNRINEVS